uniref:WAP domain-containing protein n=1 Tax=Poecilia reticulata TaxID=8081 RepID=A0A3P9Q4A4_POERE
MEFKKMLLKLGIRRTIVLKSHSPNKPGKCPPFILCGSVCMHPVFGKSRDFLSCRYSDCCCGLKCCSNGCGYECMIPVIVKPGYCGPWTAGNFCKDDGYCSGDQKCCPSYCGHFCKDPI